MLAYAINDVRNKKFTQIDAEKALETANGEYLVAHANYERIKSVLDRIAQNEGLYPWGLPRSVTIVEFKGLVPDADIPDKDPEGA
jgi:hypothetical protein